MSNTLAANDDGSTGAVSLGFTVNWFGTNYSSVYVNNNGNVTFGAPVGDYTPYTFATNPNAMIAPFFADVDTRVGAQLTYGTSTVGGHNAFGVDWIDVGYFNQHDDLQNSFQLVIISRPDVAPGAVDIEFNYDQIQWETGDASGGSGGLGGTSAVVGFTSGTGASGSYFELPGSGVNGALLDSNSTSGLIYNSRDSGVNGRYIFPVNAGLPIFSPPNLPGSTLRNAPDPNSDDPVRFADGGAPVDRQRPRVVGHWA